MLCKKCKTVISAEGGFCPVCKEKVVNKKGRTQILLAALILIFAGGTVYLFFSFTGRFDPPQDEPVLGYETVSHYLYPPGAYEAYVYGEPPETEYEYEEEGDPLLAMLKEAALAAETAMQYAENAAFITNQGFLYDLENERFILHEAEYVLILFLRPQDFFDAGLYALAENNGGLRVFAAMPRAERVTVVDGEGRHGLMFYDEFIEFLAGYENQHGEITAPELTGHVAAELVHLAVAYTFATEGYEIIHLSADDKFAFAVMRDMDDDTLRPFVFMREGDTFVIAAADFDYGADLRAAINSVLPSFNLELLPQPYVLQRR